MKRINKFGILQLFADANMNVTGQRTGDAEPYANDLSIGMKTYYDTELLENARTQHFFKQFGKKVALPKNHGKTIEFRKWNTIPPKTTPLQEGVTPTGSKFGQSRIVTEVRQYGDYGTFTDTLELTYCDNTILGATQEFGASGAETDDYVIRNAINGDLVTGQNVMFAPKSNGTAVTARSGLDATCLLTPKLVNKIATILKKNKTPKINGSYIALIHPSVAMDLRDSDGWIDVHKYAATEEIFNGEIGKLHGVRFVETINVRVWGADDETTPIGLAVYGCIFFGLDAWASIELQGAGMEMIIKQKGSAGTADPLNQRSTVGYKFTEGATVLYPERIIRLECVSTFGAEDADNGYEAA